MGLLGSDKPNPDTVKAKLEGVKLKKDWKRYTTKLKGKDPTQVKSGFFSTLGGRGLPSRSIWTTYASNSETTRPRG